ncbi:reverse transcriptase domain-containing protein [Tanacetum coccineum]
MQEAMSGMSDRNRVTIANKYGWINAQITKGSEYTCIVYQVRRCSSVHVPRGILRSYSLKCLRKSGSLCYLRLGQTIYWDGTSLRMIVRSNILNMHTWTGPRIYLLNEWGLEVIWNTIHNVHGDECLKNDTESEVQDEISRSGNDTNTDDEDIRPIYDEELMAEEKVFAIAALKNDLRKLKGNSVDTNSSRNRSKNMPRFSSNDIVHNHYLDEARKKTQERDKNSRTSVMSSARFQSTANDSKPKPRSTNYSTRSFLVSKSSCVMITTVPIADHSKNSNYFSDSKHFVCSTCHKFSPNKTSAVYEKTSPRSDLRWKPTGRIFKSVGLRWIPTGKLSDSCVGKDDSEPTHGSNVDIPNIYECKQTLDLSAGTSLTCRQKQRIDFSIESEEVESDLLCDPSSDDAKSSATSFSKPETLLLNWKTDTKFGSADRGFVALVVGGGVGVDCGGGGVKDGNDCGMTVVYTGEDSVITETGATSGLRPYHFTYPERRLTMEEMLYKFTDEGKWEHEEMRAFILINNTPMIDCEVKGVTTKGGKTTNQDSRNNDTSVHTEEPQVVNHNNEPVESNEVLTNDQPQKTSEPIAHPSNKIQTSPIPFPRRLRKEKEEAQQKKFLENLKQLYINLPFIEALAQMPKYAKFLKGLLTNKARLKEACTITINERCSAVLLNKLPSKEKDPRSFTIPCDIGQLHINNALTNLGASISLMPYTMYEKLGLCEPKATRMSLELADRSIQYPRGIIKNVLIKVDKFILPIDFVILDMPEDSRVPIILGRPFLTTAQAMIDVFNKKITLRVGDDEVIFDVDQSIKRPPTEDDECYGVDDLDDTISAEVQELLANEEPDSFLSRGLEKSIDQSDLEGCKPVGCKTDNDYDSDEPIRRIVSINTPYPVVQETAKPVKVEREHLYLASANEIDEKKPELKDLP